MWSSLSLGRIAEVCRKRMMARLLSSSSSESKTIGFVGLGNMGLPMSLNLAKKSNVIAFDMNDKAMRIAEDAGIHRANSVEDVGASQCSVIFTMLPGCNAVNQVTQVVLEGAPSNSPIVFVDCSTVRIT